MKKFVTRLVLFSAVALAMLIPASYIIDSGLHKSRHFFYSEWNDLYSGKANADLLIMGTSRAWVQFSPTILDTVLGLNSYNMGMDGAPFDVQYERLKIYLRYNKKPKYILQEVGFNTTFIISHGLPHYPQFLPYFFDSTIWHLMQKSYPGIGWTERYFPFYKYNNQLAVVKEGLWSFMGKSRPAVKYKGYAAQDRVWDNSFSTLVKKNPDGIKFLVDTEAVTIFKDYLSFCNANEIKVIMVYAPFYYEMSRYIKNHDEILAIINSLSTTYSVPLLDYTHLAIDSSKQYFYNSQHLNRKGSVLFSGMLAEDLKQYVR